MEPAKTTYTKCAHCEGTGFVPYVADSQHKPEIDEDRVKTIYLGYVENLFNGDISLDQARDIESRWRDFIEIGQGDLPIPWWSTGATPREAIMGLSLAVLAYRKSAPEAKDNNPIRIGQE